MEIVKRNKTDLVEFKKEKIVNAIVKSMNECKKGVDEDLAWDIAEEIEGEFEESDILPTVESVSDRVEELLAKNNRFDASKRYILYRNERSKLREQGWEMTDLQRDIYEKKYRFENETFDEFLDRVSGGDSEARKLIADRKFLPAGRILAGRGLNERGRKVAYSNCFVLDSPQDNLESIFDTAKKMARTYSMGGGVGINISNLRPKGATVNNAAKNTSGAISFMDLYSLTTGLIGQAGRRGALMISMDVSHPEIMDFIKVKSDLEKVTKANISVMVNDDFMNAVKNDKDWTMSFTNYENGETITETIKARKIMRSIAEVNWDYGEPGFLNWSRVNNWHLNSENPEFEYISTNPCFTGDTKLLTSKGYKTFKELNGKEFDVVNINGEITKGTVWSAGEKETIQLVLSNKHIIKCTPNHIFMTVDEEEIEAKDLKGKKIMPYTGNHKLFDDEYVKYGFIQGDGCLGRLASEDHKGLEVNIGEKDNDILFLFRNDEFTESTRKIYLQDGYKDKLIRLGFDNGQLPNRKFPSTYNNWTNLQKASFLQGCYSANGSIITNYRVSYKTTSREFAEKLVETLADDFGISAYITTNKAKEVEFDNGVYLCKESYDINIGRYKDIQTFHNEINFYHLYKKIALRNLLICKAPYVMNIKENKIEKVYDFNEPKTHWGVVEGYIAHNCGEKPLMKGGSCLLGSLALDLYVKNPFTENAEFDFESFDRDVKIAIRYLDEVLEEGIKYLPLEEQRESAINYRNLGLGFMSLADTYIKMGIKYGEEEALELLDKIGHTMINAALQESSKLAKELGVYKKYKKEYVLKSPFLLENATPEIYAMVEKYGLRHAELLSIAPNGSIATMNRGVSGGIEPHFMFSFIRKTESLYGVDTYYKVYTPVVKEYMDLYGIENEEDLPDFFVTAMTLDYKKRINTQAVAQKYIDSSISSTVNVPEDFTVEQIEDLYMYAWEKGLKGITLFRNNCKRVGILTNSKDNEDRLQKIDELKIELDELALEELQENPDICPICSSKNIIYSNGCQTCADCGYSPCSI